MPAIATRIVGGGPGMVTGIQIESVANTVAAILK
jgi:hypothetical protein